MLLRHTGGVLDGYSAALPPAAPTDLEVRMLGSAPCSRKSLMMSYRAPSAARCSAVVCTAGRLLTVVSRTQARLSSEAWWGQDLLVCHII